MSKRSINLRKQTHKSKKKKNVHIRKNAENLDKIADICPKIEFEGHLYDDESTNINDDKFEANYLAFPTFFKNELTENFNQCDNVENVELCFLKNNVEGSHVNIKEDADSYEYCIETLSCNNTIDALTERNSKKNKYLHDETVSYIKSIANECDTELNTSNETPRDTVLFSKTNKTTHKKTECKYQRKGDAALNYINRVLTERYENKKSKISRKHIAKTKKLISKDDSTASLILENDGSNSSHKYGSKNDDSKMKMLEIISHANDKMLNILEENKELKELTVKVTWNLPISHTIETRISSCPTKQQQKLFDNLDIKFRNGPFTKKEDAIIKANFERFCMEHKIKHDAEPFLCLKYGQCSILKKEERLNFARYLGRGLTNRKLFCIYSRFKNLYSSLNKGRFTAEEDAVILKYMEVVKRKITSNPFSELSKILNRPRPAIEKRYKVLQQSRKKLKPNNYIDIVKCLMRVTHSDSLEELKDKYISNREWSDVAKRLNTCKRNLQICWEGSLYTKLFHKGPIKVDDILRKLITKLDENQEDDYRKLNWNQLALPFKDVTRTFLYRLYKKAKIMYVPPHLRTNLRSCVLHLKSIYETRKSAFPDIPNIVLDF